MTAYQEKAALEGFELQRVFEEPPTPAEVLVAAKLDLAIARSCAHSCRQALNRRHARRLAQRMLRRAVWRIAFVIENAAI